MRAFQYLRAHSSAQARQYLADHPGAALLAGGSCLLDLMKQGVESPGCVIDLNFASDLARIQVAADGSLRIGAMARLADIARHESLARAWPLLCEATLAGLTPQLRESATIGGNITQRPRCIYFRESGFACNKRQPGSGCAARTGVHYGHAILGSPAASQCIAVHPSDLCTALTALGAQVEITDAQGGLRSLPLTDFHRLPDDDATRETNLRTDELIAAVVLPAQLGRAAAYVKAPPEGFPLAAAAVQLELVADRIRAARVVLGGVAHKPWPALQVEDYLVRRTADPATLRHAASLAIAGVQTDIQTAFRAPLLQAVVLEALTVAVARGGLAT